MQKIETSKTQYVTKAVLWLILIAHATFFVLALIENLPDIDYLNIKTYWIVYMVFSIATIVVYAIILIQNAASSKKITNFLYQYGLPFCMVAYAMAGMLVCINLGLYSTKYRLHEEKLIYDFILTLTDYQASNSVYTDMLLRFINAFSFVIQVTLTPVLLNFAVLMFSSEKETLKEHTN